MQRIVSSSLLGLVAGCLTGAQAEVAIDDRSITQGPVEWGDVQWGRDLEGALDASLDTGKPVLLLFQEVPG